MAKLTTAEFIDAIKELSVLELNDLVKACEEEFGVSAAAGVVVAAAGGDAAAAEEKTEFDVELTEVGPNKVKVIKVVREITGLGLKEAKDAVDGAPKVIKEQADKASAEDAKAKLEAEGAKRGIAFIDAPVSGGQAGAENGCLTVLCGGDEAAFRRVEPVLDAYAGAVTYFGPSGSGQLAKMVNQICIAGCVQGLSEAIAFGMNAGLDMPKVIEALSSGAASSWQMVNRGRTMVKGEFDFGFAVDWMRKDLGIVKDEAARNGSVIPVTRMVDGFYEEVQKAGGARWDTSSLITRLPRP